MHVVATPESTLTGLQLKDVKPSDSVVIVPPVAVTGIALPDGDVAKGFETLMEVELVLDEIVTLTTATTPFPITLALSPVSRQV